MIKTQKRTPSKTSTVNLIGTVTKVLANGAYEINLVGSGNIAVENATNALTITATLADKAKYLKLKKGDRVSIRANADNLEYGAKIVAKSTAKI